MQQKRTIISEVLTDKTIKLIVFFFHNINHTRNYWSSTPLDFALNNLDILFNNLCLYDLFIWIMVRLKGWKSLSWCLAHKGTGSILIIPIILYWERSTNLLVDWLVHMTTHIPPGHLKCKGKDISMYFFPKATYFNWALHGLWH